ncbi:hypothetical protein H6F88_26605 [Oculatella sp. FACHB-28]|uniref:hypothetical protein n=1 Tax=Oculatella sp. FACHB-28 TaxID=2692845 RepID=UPI00168248E0|nr:hypothetical protein [Oculatella sp. FACHB-28]MBD2059523.1 hypothetical protein [Oculatella sp. FACHB-28]
MIDSVQNTCQCSDRCSILRLSRVSAIALYVALSRTITSLVADPLQGRFANCSYSLYEVLLRWLKLAHK